MDPYCVHRKYGVRAPKRHRDMKFLKFVKSAKKLKFRESRFIQISSKFLRGQKFLCRGRGAQIFFPWESSNLGDFENIWFVGSTTPVCWAVGVFGKKGDLIITQPLYICFILLTKFFKKSHICMKSLVPQIHSRQLVKIILSTALERRNPEFLKRYSIF